MVQLGSMIMENLITHSDISTPRSDRSGVNVLTGSDLEMSLQILMRFISRGHLRIINHSVRFHLEGRSAWRCERLRYFVCASDVSGSEKVPQPSEFAVTALESPRIVNTNSCFKCVLIIGFLRWNAMRPRFSEISQSEAFSVPYATINTNDDLFDMKHSRLGYGWSVFSEPRNK